MTADTTPAVLAERIVEIPGISVEFVAASSVADILVKLRAGEIDAGAGLSLEALLQQAATSESTLPFALYALSVDRKDDPWVSLIVHKDSDVTSISQLKDKVCICAPNDQAEYLLRSILSAGGVPTNQQRVLRHGPSPLLQFKTGEATCILTAEPVISQAIADGHRILDRGPISRWLFSGKDIAVAGSVISREFVRRHPNEARAFVQAVFMAAEKQRTTPELIRPIFAKETYGALPPEAYNHFAFSAMVRATRQSLESAQEYADRLLRDGVLKSPARLERLFADELAGSLEDP